MKQYKHNMLTPSQCPNPVKQTKSPNHSKLINEEIRMDVEGWAVCREQTVET